jgi:N-acetyl-1-D-myo-inositol-2-amino-2-deoxy-alpha-D-glucopyranoside deacetylase
MRGMLFVHAHPDDEAIGTGATIARYAAEGVHVTVVTCTLGEHGDVELPELALLGADCADQLGGYRLAELRAACAALGVRDLRLLGGAGRWRDSELAGGAGNAHPRAFCRADVEEAAALLAEIVRELRPRVLVTYDPTGTYGHPDHVQAHRVAMRAAELAGDDGPQRIWWIAPHGTPPERADAAIEAGPFAAAKLAALRAHASQGAAAPDGAEHYLLARGERGREDDLLAGLDTPRRRET